MRGCSFDIGIQTLKAVLRHEESKQPYCGDPRTRAESEKDRMEKKAKEAKVCARCCAPSHCVVRQQQRAKKS